MLAYTVGGLVQAVNTCKLCTTDKSAKARKGGKMDIMQALSDYRDSDIRCTWKETETPRVNSKELREKLPDVFAAFSSVSVSRRFLVH